MKSIIYFYLFVVLSGVLYSQNIIDKSVYSASTVDSEFDVAINPIDTNNIVVVSMSKNNNRNELAVYYTFDFGVTWSKSTFNGIFGEVLYVTDPVMEFDEYGNAYIAFLGAKNFISFPDNLNVRYDTKYLKSNDGGVTWNILNIDAETDDKPWMVIDTFIQSPFKGNRYVSGGSINFWSIDKNEQPQKSSLIDFERYDVEESFALPTIAISKKGTVFLAYNDFIGWLNSSKCVDSIVVVRSYDGGKTFGIPKKDRSLITYFKKLPWKISGVSDRMSPKQYLAVDNSNGCFEGRLYLTYTNKEKTNSPFLDVFITYSDDDGKNWSIPKAVHSNTPNYTHQFFSSIFINNKGYLMLDWYDKRNDEFGINADFYFGLSKDGGESFKIIKLTDKPTDFTKVGINNNKFGVGDYHQCVATDRYAFSFWADGRSNDGNLNIYFAKIDLENIDSVIISRIKEDFVIDGYFPNPVLDYLKVDLSLKRKMKIKWQIFDNNSKLIKESKFLSLNPLKNTIFIPFKGLPTSVYYLRFVSEEGQIKSITLLKT